MIIGILNKGSGLGDQLFSYIATRVRAADLNVPFGFVGKEFFKGASFMNLDWGKETSHYKYFIEESTGKLIVEPDKYFNGHKGSQSVERAVVAHDQIFEIDTTYFNPEFFFIEDNTVIDGFGAQSIQYFEHRLDEVREWLKVEPLDTPDDLCVCNFRGGEYKFVSELFLTPDYWRESMSTMTVENGVNQWEIHTDDPNFANDYFNLHGFNPYKPYKIIKDIELNWRSLRYAKNAIISNSAFAIIPRLLAHLDNPEAVTIAPFGWNARNASLTKWMGRPNNYYSKFTYI